MNHLFKSHLEKFIEIDEKEFLEIMTFFVVKKIKKKENVLVEGPICKSHYFVLHGCLRKFFINKRCRTNYRVCGRKLVITDNLAYEHKLPTEFYIQAVEPSEILKINRESQ